jgi:CDP-diglyceride synthetase
LVWPGLVIAFTLGFAVGLATCSPALPPRAGWVGAALTLGCFVVAAILAVLEVVPGRAALWLETALLLVAAYVPGCGLGGLLGSVLRRSRASSS